MRINTLKLSVITTKDQYGFDCTFESGLNIIRGDNSSGKSTLFNSMLFALGLEEILGGRGEKVLPYSLKEYLPIGDEKQAIVSSSVELEIANQSDEVITLRRYIKSSERSSKLIEITKGNSITAPDENYEVQPTFIHDPGSASNDQVGFFRYLENFLELRLPLVPGASGNEVKLYLQTVFAAIFIEQKRGWTDYIANIPYFGIRSVQSKVIEYLLNLDVFENDRIKNQLNNESSEIHQAWESEKAKTRLICDRYGLTVKGLPAKPISDFERSRVVVLKHIGDEELSVEAYMDRLLADIQEIKNKQSASLGNAPSDLVSEMEAVVSEVARLNSLHESLVSDIQMNRSLINEYEETRVSLQADLNKNKIAKKLKSLGAEMELSISSDQCPTCHQHVDDSLLLADTQIQPMDIDENIGYLDKQIKVLDKYKIGIEGLITKQQRQLLQVQKEISDKKSEVLSKRRDLSSISEISESDLRNQIRYEDDVRDLQYSTQELETIFEDFGKLSVQFLANKQSRTSLPSNYLSQSDANKVRALESAFREMAGEFGYKSAEVKEIIVNDDNYLPFLSGLALREIFDKSDDSAADIKADSSASDFVRLIWSYLLSLYEASSSKGGNHIGVIGFDEPGQHSMRDTSVNALFKRLNKYSGLQSIVAASFDENDSVFEAETFGVEYKLISVGEKLIKKIG